MCGGGGGKSQPMPKMPSSSPIPMTGDEERRRIALQASAMGRTVAGTSANLLTGGGGRRSDYGNNTGRLYLGA